MSFSLSKIEIQKICTAGSHAPSGANSQPWKVQVSKNKITVSINEKKKKSFLDVERYASFFSLGSFVENVSIASSDLGLDCTIKVKTDTNPEKNQVEMIFSKNSKVEKNTLAEYIEKRCTNRNISDGTSIPEPIVKSLKDAVAKKDVNFTLKAVSERDKKVSIAKTLGIVDAIRTTNDTMFEELIEEVRWTEKEIKNTKDGIDVRTLELPKNYERMLLLLKNNPAIRKMIPKKAYEESTKQLLTRSSHLCCIASNKPVSYKHILNAGKVVQHTWLKATKHSIAFHPWTITTFLGIRAANFKGKGLSKEEKTQIIKAIESIRKEFNLTNEQTPLFLFRLSYAKQPKIVERKHNWNEFTTY